MVLLRVRERTGTDGRCSRARKTVWPENLGDYRIWRGRSLVT